MNAEKLRELESDLNVAATAFRAHVGDAGQCKACNADTFTAGPNCVDGKALQKSYSRAQRKFEAAKKMPLKPSLKAGTIDLGPTEQPEICG